MAMADVIDIIEETEATHGVHEATEEKTREVFVEVKSVSRSEYYNAYNSGFRPSLVFKVVLAEEYRNERYIRYRGEKYQVIRTYLTNDGGIEITVERSDEHGGSE